MREGQINSAGVNVQGVAQIFHGHRGALDVPAGAAGTDRSLPEMLAGLGRFPEREVARAFFLIAIVIDARAGLDAAYVDLREFSVVRKFCDAVVDRTFAGVGADFAGALRDERFGLAAEGVVEADFGHGWSVVVKSLSANRRL